MSLLWTVTKQYATHHTYFASSPLPPSQASQQKMLPFNTKFQGAADIERQQSER